MSGKCAGAGNLPETNDDYVSGYGGCQKRRKSGEYRWKRKYVKDIVCPDGCVLFRLTAKKLGNENFYKGKFYEEAGNGI